MYLFLLARRYLFSRWIMSAIAVLLILFAVFSLVVVSSVFEGFGDQMREMVRGTTSHVAVLSSEALSLPYADELASDIRAIPRVAGASPYVETMAMLQAQHALGSCTDYVHIKGIDPVGEAEVGDLEYYLLRDEDLTRICEEPNRPLGRALERKPLSADEIARLFSSEYRDEVWKRYKERLAAYDPDRSRLLDRKLPPPIVVGIQALLGPGRLMNSESLIHLTTYSPHKGEIRTGEFLVVGAFHTGLFEVDQRTIYMPIGAACEFMDLFDETLPDADGYEGVGGWRVSGVSVALANYETDRTEVIKAIGQNVLPRYFHRLAASRELTRIFDPRTLTWEERRKNLLEAVKIEKRIVGLIIGILVIFAGAIIALILTLNVTEKRRDLGILKAVGAHEGSLFVLFILLGGTICFVGLVLGFLSGLVFSQHINELHDVIYGLTGKRLFPPDVYYFDRIPVAMKMLDLLLITGFTVLAGFLGSLFPAIWASRQDPIHAIHAE